MESARLAVPKEHRPSGEEVYKAYKELDTYRFHQDPNLLRFEVDDDFIESAIEKAKGSGAQSSTLRKTLLLSDEDLRLAVEKIGWADDLAVFLKSLNLESEVEGAVFQRMAKLIPQKMIVPVTIRFNSSRYEANRSESFQKWEGVLEVLGFTRSAKRKAVS